MRRAAQVSARSVGRHCMSDSSLLETTAEIAIALAGFVSIFLVLASRDGRFPPHDAFSVRLIVIASVACVFYAVFPLLLHALGVTEPVVWRVSSGLMATVNGAIIAFMLRAWRAIPQEDKRASAGLHLAFDNFFGAIVLLCLIGNVLAWPWTPSGGVYLLAIWSNLAPVGASFVILIFERVVQD